MTEVAGTNVHPLRDAAKIAVADGLVVIEQLVVTDPEVTGFLERTPEGRWAENLVRAMRIGVLSMDANMNERFRDTMRFVNGQMDGALEAFERRVAATLGQHVGDGDHDGLLQQRTREIFADARRALREEFTQLGPEVLGAKGEEIERRLKSRADELLQNVERLFHDGGPFHQQLELVRAEVRSGQASLKDEIELVKEHVVRRQGAEENPNPVDEGYDYEDAIQAVLSRIGEFRGDDVQHVDRVSGRSGRSRKGDTVVTLNVERASVTMAPRVAFEIRDRSGSPISLSDIEATRKNRDAQVVVIIGAHRGSLPKEYADRPFHVGRGTNLVTLHLEPDNPYGEELLLVAYELAARLAYETVRATHDGDWGEIEDCARELEEELAILNEVCKDFAAIETRAGTGRKRTDGLRERALSKAGRLVAIARSAAR